MLSVSIAKAKTAVKKKKAAERQLIESIANEVISRIPVPKDGLNGKDAPSLEEIMQEVRKALPEPKVVQNKVVERIEIKEEVPEDRLRDVVQSMIPEPSTEKDVQKDVQETMQDSEYVTKDELKDILRRIDRAIVSGGGGNFTDLLGRIERLEQLQQPITADNTVVTADTTERTSDEI